MADGTNSQPSVADQLEDQQQDKATDTAVGIGTSTALGAASGAALGTSTAAAGTTAAASSGAATAFAYAWPIAVLVGIYTAHKGQKDLKKATGTNLTKDEQAAIHDVTGIHGLSEKATPKEIQKLIPNEVETVLNPTKAVGAILGSGKHDDQIMRDRLRVNMERGGFAERINGSHHITLADGSKFDIGVDGENTFAATNPELGVSEWRPYNIDATNEFSHQTIGFMNPLAAMMSGGDEKLTSDGVGYLGNAAMSNASTIEQVQENARGFYEQIFGEIAAEHGISTQEVALGSLQSLYDMGNISEDDFIAMSNGVRQVYGTAALSKKGAAIVTAPTLNPAYKEGGRKGDPAKGEVNNTATAGVQLDDTDTLGNPTADQLPPVGDVDNAVPRPTPEQPVEAPPAKAPVLQAEPQQPLNVQGPAVAQETDGIQLRAAETTPPTSQPAESAQPSDPNAPAVATEVPGGSVATDFEAQANEAQAAAEAERKKSFFLSLAQNEAAKIQGLTLSAADTRRRSPQQAQNLVGTILG